MANPDRESLRILRELGDKGVSHGQGFTNWVVWVSLLCIGLFIAWAQWAEIDEVTRGEGRVVPINRMQSIQSLEGGILAELLVGRGDLVDKNQPLVRMDETRFRSAYLETNNQATALRVSIARLNAEVRQKDAIQFPEDVDQSSDLVRNERALFRARLSRLREAEQSTHQEISVVQRQLELVEPLVQRRAVSEMEKLKLSQTITGLKGKLAELSNAYMQEARTELSARQAELNALEQTMNQRRDQLERTVLRSHVRGRVNEIRINTVGGVIQPGESIMDITPIETELLIETRVRPQDVAFVAPGMPASVKITAYDYTIYGDLAGEVEQISEDTIEVEGPRGKEFYYLVTIRANRSYLEHKGKTLSIRPGMVAQVDIQSGKRTVLSYLLKPIIKAKLY